MRTLIILMTGLFVATAVPGSMAFAAAGDTDDAATIKADTETIKTCLAAARKAGHDGRDCIGRVSDPCEAETGGSTMSMLACENKEIAVWDALLNDEYQKLLGALPGKAAQQVRAAERLWVQLKDADCQVPDAIFEGGTMSIPIAAQCVLTRTAWRTLQMRDWWGMAHPEDDTAEDAAQATPQ
jgi:uncharacterized protein YecT (DUF1311 family)